MGTGPEALAVGLRGTIRVARHTEDHRGLDVLLTYRPYAAAAEGQERTVAFEVK